MSYPVYNSATALAATTTATNTKRNKGVLIVNDGAAETSAVIYATTSGGTQGAAITIIVAIDHAPIVLPVRVYKTGAITGCTVYELT